MVFHWSLSDNKSHQVSRTLLSILADFNNAVVWMVSTRPLISKSSCPCTRPLVTVLRAPITIDTTITFILHSFSNSLTSSRYSSVFFSFFQFYSVFRWDSKVHNSAWSIFVVVVVVVDNYKVWWSGQDKVIHLYLKIPEKFMRLILQDGFLVVHIPFICMVEFKPLAQFPVDHLVHLVVICCILLLCDWSFCFYHHITYIGCFVASYLFLLWYDESL